jgi:peroxiredoxin Q/BCP
LLPLLIVAPAWGNSDMRVGNEAPAFALPDQHGNTRRLEEFSGKWLVLYFYPKDDTPGCTKEACHFRDDIFQFRDLGAEVVGVSIDSTESHKEFAEKYSLPFPLLADHQGKVASSYGSLWKLGPIRFAKRHSFIISPDGRIAKIYTSVKPDGHSDDVIRDLRELQSGDK